MKQSYLLTISFIILFFSNCDEKKDFKRETFLGLKLGSSINEIENQLQVLKENHEVYVVSQNVPYLKRVLDDKEYYITPLFTSKSGDSLVTTIKVLYLDNLNNIKDDIKTVQSNENPMNLQFISTNRVNSFLLKEQVKRELIAKYDKPTSEGKLNQNGEIELTSWDNKNGIDILLTYKSHRSIENDYGNS